MPTVFAGLLHWLCDLDVCLFDNTSGKGGDKRNTKGAAVSSREEAGMEKRAKGGGKGVGEPVQSALAVQLPATENGAVSQSRQLV